MDRCFRSRWSTHSTLQRPRSGSQTAWRRQRFQRRHCTSLWCRCSSYLSRRRNLTPRPRARTLRIRCRRALSILRDPVTLWWGPAEAAGSLYTVSSLSLLVHVSLCCRGARRAARRLRDDPSARRRLWLGASDISFTLVSSLKEDRIDRAEVDRMEAAHKLRCDRSVNLQCSDSITNASHVHTARALWPSHSPCGPDS